MNITGILRTWKLEPTLLVGSGDLMNARGAAPLIGGDGIAKVSIPAGEPLTTGLLITRGLRIIGCGLNTTK